MRINLLAKIIGAVLLALGAGCVEHVYLPAEHATASLPENGLPAALYQVPPGRPEGEVKLAVLGKQRVPDSDEKELAVRMIVTNNSDTPWRLDLREQRLVYNDGFEREPSAAYLSGEPLPVVEISARSRRSIDLAYPFPDGVSKQTVQLHWALITPTQYVSARTDFRRQDLQEAYAYGPPMVNGYFYEPFYYTNPFGFSATVIRERPIGPRVVHGRRVIIPARRPVGQIPFEMSPNRQR